MATWTMPDWAKGEEIGEATALPDQVADRNLDLDCNFSLDVKVARTHYTGSVGAFHIIQAHNMAPANVYAMNGVV